MSKLRRSVRFVLLGLSLLCLLAITPLGTTSAQTPPVVGGTDPASIDQYNYRALVVKFDEGSDVRMRNDALVSLSSTDLSPLYSTLNAESDIILSVGRLFTRPEEEIAADRLEAQTAALEPMPDLNLYYTIELTPDATAADAAALLDRLNALDVVQTAYAEPYYQPAQVDIPPTTPNWVANQDYREAAPNGIDIDAAWYYGSAGRGQGVRIVDIEWGWNFNHEDLNLDASDLLGGTNDSDTDHGTAVMGILLAYENGYGVTGLVPNADGKVVSNNGLTVTYPYVANAIDRAYDNTVSGDIILYEMHAYGPDSGLTCPCNCGQFEYIPMEYWQANFDVTRIATANGRIVVEAGGNGSMDLDHSRYNVTWNGFSHVTADGAFDRTFRNSGAILVGASTAYGRSPMCWTNYGSRVDVHGWGEQIYTLGYGGLFDGVPGSGTDANQLYTAGFSGTSGASPIVVGAAAALRGVGEARGTFWSNTTIRNTLVNTGWPQAASSKNIGPRPNLAEALESLIPPPSNNLFANAVNIVSLPYTTTRNIDGSTKSGTDPSMCAGYVNTVWFRYTPAANGYFNVNTYGSTLSDTIVGVFTGSEGALTQVACNDDDFNNSANIRHSALTFYGTAGTTYRILVGKYGSNPTLGATNYTLNVTQVAPIDTNLVSDGGFDYGVSSWGVWNSTHNTTGSLLHIARNLGTGDGGFYQFIAQNVPTNAPLELMLEMSNTSPVPKTINIQLRNTTWSDVNSCWFTLPANSPGQRYTMRVRTDMAWSPIVLQGWLQNPDGQMSLDIDNVSLRYRPGELYPTTASCTVEPPSLTNLLFDGTFNAGLAAWAPWESNAQVLPISGNPALYIARNIGSVSGGFYQWNPYSAPAGGEFEFTFRLGNSSGVAKTVNILLRHPDWSEMRNCWFTVPANTPLTPRTMRFRSDSAWPNIVVQAWLQNPDGLLGMTFDDMSLQYNPSLTVSTNPTCTTGSLEVLEPLTGIDPALVGEGGISTASGVAAVELPNGDLSVVVPVDPSQMSEGGILAAPPVEAASPAGVVTPPVEAEKSE